MNSNKYPLDFNQRSKKYKVKVFDETDLNYVIANYKSKTVSALSNELGFTTELIWRYMRKFKLKPLKPRIRRSFKNEKIAHCIESFVFTNDIIQSAKMNNVASCTLSIYLKKHYFKLKESENTITITLLSKV